MTGEAGAWGGRRRHPGRCGPFADRALHEALARALAGSVLFALPLLMTAEMWTLGFTMAPERLALLLVLTVPLLAGLSYYGGFRHNVGLRDSIVDGFVAFGIGTAAAALVLIAFGVLDSSSSVEQVVGVLALESVPAGMGAALASSQLGLGKDHGEGREEHGAETRDWGESYAGELFLMLAGALFFAFNVAPTDEVGLVTVEQGHAIWAGDLEARRHDSRSHRSFRPCRWVETGESAARVRETGRSCRAGGSRIPMNGSDADRGRAARSRESDPRDDGDGRGGTDSLRGLDAARPSPNRRFTPTPRILSVLPPR